MSRRAYQRGWVAVQAMTAIAVSVLAIPSALAETPAATAALVLEANHADAHGEPKAEKLTSLMPFRATSRSASLGRSNRGYLREGVFLNDSDVLKVKNGSLNSRHGTRELVELIEHGAKHVNKRYRGSRLTVGDLSRKGGGRLTPHKSHRSGRDVDLGFYMLDRSGKRINAEHFVMVNHKGYGRLWGRLYKFDVKRNWALIEALLDHPSIDVQHIFVVNHVRRRLLRQARLEKASPELIARAERIIRQPRRGPPHRSHFHVRIFCADDDLPQCKDVGPFYSWHPRPGTDTAQATLSDL